jgi:hypothetical protein
VSAAPQPVTAAASRVLLVVADSTVSQAAIRHTVELAGGAAVTVVGVGPDPASRADPTSRADPASRADHAEPEQLRRSVALAMSVLEQAGVVALGHIAVTGSPARTLARVARARGARVVVLDQLGLSAGGLAAELRRRMYGSGTVVVTANDRAGRWVVP